MRHMEYWGCPCAISRYLWVKHYQKLLGGLLDVVGIDHAIVEVVYDS